MDLKIILGKSEVEFKNFPYPLTYICMLFIPLTRSIFLCKKVGKSHLTLRTVAED